MSTVPFSLPAGARMLGEIVSWDTPDGWTWTFSQLQAGLTAAGLDPKYARPLSARNVFIRALRRRAVNRMVTPVIETVDLLTYQLTMEHKTANRVDFIFDATATFDKATGAVTATDAQLAADVTAEIAPCVEARKTADVTRLIHGLFEKNSGALSLFPIKGGVYFVPIMHAGFIDSVELFCKQIGVTFVRFPVPDAAPAPAPSAPTGPTPPAQPTSVSIVMSNGVDKFIAEYEAELEKVRCGKGDDKDLKRAQRAMTIALEKIAMYRQFLGYHATRLEDYVAVVQKRIRDEEEVQRRAKEAAEAQLPVAC